MFCCLIWAGVMWTQNQALSSVTVPVMTRALCTIAWEAATKPALLRNRSSTFLINLNFLSALRLQLKVRWTAV